MPRKTRVVIGGVDTHEDVHVAAVVDEVGKILDTKSQPPLPLRSPTSLPTWWKNEVSGPPASNTTVTTSTVSRPTSAASGYSGSTSCPPWFCRPTLTRVRRPGWRDLSHEGADHFGDGLN